MTTPEPAADEVARAKAALRARLLAARAARSIDQRRRDAESIAAAARALLDERRPTLVAAYLSIGSEPGTEPLLSVIENVGGRIIVPVLRDDADLDWAPYSPGASSRAGRRGTLEPSAEPLGVEALRAADLVIVPALAVDRRGRRLGRGGGGYDRALLRAAPGVTVLAVVHDDEVLDDVPAAAHDRLVGGALTPSGVALFSADAPS